MVARPTIEPSGRAFVQDSDLTIHVGDVRTVLPTLESGSVDCCVTSPPYWGLRDYGADGQLGLEASPDEYVVEMVAVFREVRRVLADHGTLFLNLGDSYASSSTYNTTNTLHTEHGWKQDAGCRPNAYNVPGLKPKDLVGIPWRVAFALQADGWYLRSDIIWAKPNPMPESVTDRPTKAHEYVFLLSKRPSYFFDQEAVREPHSPDGRRKTVHDHETPNSHANYDNIGNGHERWPNGGRNVRSVWEIEQTGRPNGARHTLDDAYFAEIATEEQAYWLGFLYADGYLGRRHVDLQLAEKDHDHVLRFRAALGSSANVNEPRDGRSRVVISSRRMADDLRAWGMGAKDEIPALEPKLVRHFVRGVFDGDGSAWSYLPSSRPRRRYSASFLGHERLLGQIRDLLGLRGKPKLDRGIHKIAVASADDLARLYGFMYDDATVYLERKRAEFPQAQFVAPDVWSIATQPYPEAHFATFPEELPRRCILAGCPEWVCGTCGAPRTRIVERELHDKKGYGPTRKDAHLTPQAMARNGNGRAGDPASTTLGWSDCGHDNYRPGVTLDPFLGSGTTALVARKHGRRCVGVELSVEYARLAAQRCQQLSLLAG